MFAITSKRLFIAILLISFVCVVTNQFRMAGYISLAAQSVIAYTTFFLNLVASVVGTRRTPHRVWWTANGIGSILTLVMISEPTIPTALWALCRVLWLKLTA
jgi:hypothetical protein